MKIKKTILIADDHPLLLIGLRGIIDGFEDYQLISEVSNGNDAISQTIALQPDIAIIDLELPGVNGIEVLQQVKNDVPSCLVAILTSHKDEKYLNQAIEAGADGYLLKDFASDELTKCFNHFENKETYYSEQLNIFISPAEKVVPNLKKLSRSELKVLRLIGQEKSSKEIGEILFISPKTVDNHRSHIIKKLDITSKKHSLFSWATKHEAYL